MIRLSSPRTGSSWILAQLMVFVLLAVPSIARAGDLAVKVEPGLAFPLTQPQSQRFGFGGGVNAKLLYGVAPYFDVTVGASFVALPTSTNSLSSGTGAAWGYGPGLRLKGRHDSEAFHGASPWVDADALYVRTGALNRFGFAAGAGLAFPLDHARKFWLGPFVRYQQVVGSGGAYVVDQPSIDSRDAKVLFVGLSLEMGPSRRVQPVAAVESPPATTLESPHAAVEPPHTPPAVVETPAAAPLPDRDGDGVPDQDDRCPDVPGPVENQGCPIYDKVVVHKDKLELKEKVAFAKDTAKLVPKSYPLLDQVAKALQDNKNLRVSVEGHTSSGGTKKHNQDLSQRRAAVVLEYLVRQGVARDRLSSRGFSSSRPISSNQTSAGRESNRRVEFVVQSIILNKDGSVR